MNRLAPPPTIPADHLRDAVDWAIASRRSIRAFLPTPVPRAEVEALLDVARFAGSGTNTQPWQVHVLTGAAKDRLAAALLAVHDDPERLAALQPPYDYYPRQWTSPFLERRRKVGWDLYRLLGIGRADRQRMHEQHGRNYRFFDAPVGLVFTMDRVLAQGSFIDYGMFLQGVMVAARARGLDTCPQAAFVPFDRVIARELALPASQVVVCGMALGHADPDRVENTLVTDREPVGAFTVFHDAD